MSSNEGLPTLSKLGGEPLANTDATAVAEGWFTAFAKAVEASDAQAVAGLFLEDGYWRDMLALTWSFRTFHGRQAITKFLSDRLAQTKVSNLRLSSSIQPELLRPWPDVAWIQAFFEFDSKVGTVSGIVRLVYIPSGTPTWQCYTLYTNLESLHGVKESVGPNRNYMPNHGLWLTQRQKELAFEDEEPTVLIIGAGQSGLDVAARLKHLGVKSVLIERNKRIGNQWRERYQALCLHDPVWYDHMPYLSFPSSWPVYTPAHKLADWLESYAHHLELNVWTETTIKSSHWKPETKTWEVTVVKPDGTERVFKPKHIVYAAGLAGGVPNMPKIAGMEDFKGKIVHSTGHKTAKDYIDKKVVVVGACTSAHDICQDFYNHGVDVTMFQRASTYIMTTKNGMPVVMRGLYWEGGPPTDVADRLSASLPNPVLKLVHKRYTEEIAEKDADLLKGLEKVGFKLNYGSDGSGFLYLAYSRGGGYYLDVGASQLIIDGKIKLKNGTSIERFTESGIKFADGSELPADLVLFATGFGDVKEALRKIFDDNLLDQLKPAWGVSEEGEIKGVWGDSGHEGFWYMMGNLCLCRFHSKHIALQIKALEDGVIVDRYTS